MSHAGNDKNGQDLRRRPAPRTAESNSTSHLSGYVDSVTVQILCQRESVASALQQLKGRETCEP